MLPLPLQREWAFEAESKPSEFNAHTDTAALKDEEEAHLATHIDPHSQATHVQNLLLLSILSLFSLHTT